MATENPLPVSYFSRLLIVIGNYPKAFPRRKIRVTMLLVMITLIVIYWSLYGKIL
jgi:hypothetical protein